MDWRNRCASTDALSGRAWFKYDTLFFDFFQVPAGVAQEFTLGFFAAKVNAASVPIHVNTGADRFAGKNVHRLERPGFSLDI